MDDIKCYKVPVQDGINSRIIYYITTDKARHGYVVWTSLARFWARGIYPWDRTPLYTLFAKKTNMQEASKLEVLLVSGSSPEQAIEKACR
jgi:hypothetical protein